MKLKYLSLLFMMVSYFHCSSQNMDSLLVNYYKQAKEFPEDTLFPRFFFDIFPNNFALFDSIYGYNEKTETPGVLYYVSQEHITFFCELHNLIPKNEYYRKIIDVSLNGYWGADAIASLKICIWKLFLEDTEKAIEVLHTYSESDIKSFWRFFYLVLYYDHPLSIARHSQMQEKVRSVSLQMYELMEEQYNHDYTEYLKNEKR